MTTLDDTALQIAPAGSSRGYWATVGRRLLRDNLDAPPEGPAEPNCSDSRL